MQLIEAESGAHLWAERFDKPVADLFDMQDEIVARLANQLSTEIVSVEARRAERTSNPGSVDFWFRGMDWINKGVNPESLAKARGCFDRALAMDPENTDALLGSLSMRSSLRCFHSTTVRSALQLQRGSRSALFSCRPGIT